jgi:hypothetical protein
MKSVVEMLAQYSIVFKSLREIRPKELGSRKKVGIYLGVDLKSYYALVLEVEKKSRVLQKEALELMMLHEKVQVLIGAKVTKKYIIIKAPLCSHAKKLLQEQGWKVWHEV